MNGVIRWVLTKNYVAYTITVTAGKDGCKELYVIDQFTSNGNLVSYADNITSTETVLKDKDSSDNHEPYETITGSTNHGKIYLADSADSTKKNLKQDKTISQILVLSGISKIWVLMRVVNLLIM